jgi:hypothetical protein
MNFHGGGYVHGGWKSDDEYDGIRDELRVV